jgi:hypothetical protein
MSLHMDSRTYLLVHTVCSLPTHMPKSSWESKQWMYEEIEQDLVGWQPMTESHKNASKNDCRKHWVTRIERLPA